MTEPVVAHLRDRPVRQRSGGERQQDRQNDVVRDQAYFAATAATRNDRAHISHPRRLRTWKTAITQPTKKLIVRPIAAA